MSTSFLSRQDVERWLPEPTPSNNPGFVAKLFVTIRAAFASLAVLFSQTNVNDRDKRCQNELERFFLWGQGLSVVEGHLDDILVHSEELHFRVLSLLMRLGTVILESLSRGQSSQSMVLFEQCDDLRTLLETTEAKIQESELELMRTDTLSVSDTSEIGIEEILEDVTTYVDCLLDLAPSLDNPALDMPVANLDQHSTQNKELFDVSTEEAAIYCRKIRDRFASLPKCIVERLAEANAIRAATLRSARSRNDFNMTITDVKSLPSESIFSTIDRGVTDTTKSTAPPSSIFSSLLKRVTKRPDGISQFSDNASKATLASFSTSPSTTSQGRVRVPPIPELEGDSFTCPICYKRIFGLVARKAWKKHVFEDLKPYVCTIDKCEEPGTLYTHSAMWAEHENSHVVSSTAECPFCGASFQQKAITYFKHVSTHLQEVSLSVLPHPADEDDGFVSEQSDEEDISSVWNLNMAENIKNDSSLEQEESSSQSKPVQKLSEPAGVARPSDHEQDQIASSSTQANSASPDEIDLDDIIDRLLKVWGTRPGTQVELRQSELRYLCTEARGILLSQQILLELEAPIKICGDIHGQYYDLLRLFECTGFPPEANYLFMGNYVNYGTQSIETICLLLAYKIKYPKNFFLLRGSHETSVKSRIYGFYDECKRRYSVITWKAFLDCFNCLPLAAIIDEKIFVAHGGLSPDLNSMQQIRRLLRPTDIPNTGLMCDLLFSNPNNNISGWAENESSSDGSGEGIIQGFTFGPDVVSQFLKKHDMDLIVRSNQVVEDGYEFFANRQLVTIFSAPNYKGVYDNAGAIMSIDESLLCSFQIIKPVESKTRRFNRT